MRRSFQAVLLTAVGVGALSAGGGTARAATYLQTDLVSDLSAVGAKITDSSLKNPWGLSFLPGSPIWVSDQGTQTTALYNVTGGLNVAKNAGLPSVAIPPSGAAGPTGQVANGGSGFGVTGTGSSALFIFANLNGSISAWNGSAGTTAVTERTTPGATLHRARHQFDQQSALRRQRRRNRQHRRLQQLLCASNNPPGRSVHDSRGDQDRRARAVQRQGHQRRRLCHLCAVRPRGADRRNQGNGRLGGVQRGWDAREQFVYRR